MKCPKCNSDNMGLDSLCRGFCLDCGWNERLEKGYSKNEQERDFYGSPAND